MAAGLTASLTTASFNSQVGSIINQLDGVMHQVDQMRTWIIGAGGGLSGLEATPLSYSVTDATNIFNAFADLEQLYQIYIGASSQNTLRGNNNAFDYRTNASLIGGTLVH
jgi:hypothetical protein